MRFVVMLMVAIAAKGQVKPLLELEGQTRDPSLSPDGKTLAFEWCKPDYSCGIYTRPLAGGDVKLLVGDDARDGSAHSPRWSPDGQTIAFARFYSHWDDHLVTRRASGGEERDFGNVCSGQVSWSPDGRFLAASRQLEADDCRPTLYAADTGQRVRQLALKGSGPMFSPDGRTIAYAEGKALKLLRLGADYRPAGPATTLLRELREISAIAWMRDGKEIIYQAWGDMPYLRRVAVRPGSRPAAIPGLTTQVLVAQLLSDGTALATETPQVDELWRADLGATPVKLETISPTGCSAGGLGCSPDGRLQVFVSMRTGISEIWLANGDGTNERPLVRPVPSLADPKTNGFPMLVGWSPDQKWIAFSVRSTRGNADFRSDLYVVPSSGGSLRRLAQEAYAIDFVVWSPDSKSLYGVRDWPVDDRAHDLQSPLVRIDLADGKITPLGADGIWPKLSGDAKYLYFFTAPRSRLSRIAIDGGVEQRLWDHENLSFVSYAVGAHDLYLFQEESRRSAGRAHMLVRFDPEKRQMTPLAETSFDPRSAYLSADEKYLYFEQHEDSKTRVVLLQIQ